jgi:hypothetical protein
MGKIFAIEDEAEKEAVKDLKYLEWFCKAHRVPIKVISICLDNEAYKKYEGFLEDWRYKFMK